MNARLRGWIAPCLAVVLASAAGCASIRVGEERDAYFRKNAGTFTYAKSCLDVWPSVLAVLGAHGYPLQGRDRQYAGEAKQSGIGAFLDQGYETRAVDGGGLIVLTGWLAAAEGRSRYEVTGQPGQPSGCAVTFTRIDTGTIDPATENRTTDYRIQLELMQKVDPAAVTRIEGGAPKGG